MDTQHLIETEKRMSGMRLTVLVDNNIPGGEKYYAEHGLSFFIEEGGSRILFDTGCSDILLRNACKMGIDLKMINAIVLSHGHYDHTWGLTHLLDTLDCSKMAESGIKFIAHPDVFKPKVDQGKPIGMNLSAEFLNLFFKISTSREPVWLSEKLVFLGEIERHHDFENNKMDSIIDNGVEKEDYLIDDSALAYKTEDGIIIITGCSHSGICNIVDYACKVCEDDRIIDIIGGLHLLNPEQSRMDATIAFFKEHKPYHMHACHCTDLASKIALSQIVNIEESGVGLTLQYE
jgi:7,8-dihydropterin-6-yl-methyl-4-(beta-D-ribofuranosyl)aminobenzene 5'-phosphate synthase